MFGRRRYYIAQESAGCGGVLVVLFGVVMIIAAIIYAFMRLIQIGLLVLTIAMFGLFVFCFVKFLLAAKLRPSAMVCPNCSAADSYIYQDQSGRKMKQMHKCRRCGLVWPYYSAEDVKHKQVRYLVFMFAAFIASVALALAYYSSLIWFV